MRAWVLLALVVSGCHASLGTQRDAYDAGTIPAIVGYPDVLRNAKIEGVERVRVEIDSSGERVVGHGRSLESTHSYFQAALIHSLARWRLPRELIKRGQRPDSLDVTAEFRLRDAPECPRLPPCSRSGATWLPPARAMAQSQRGSGLVTIAVISCPPPEPPPCPNRIERVDVP